MLHLFYLEDRRAKKIINDKKLDIDFKAITFGTYGAFGSSTHSLIEKATADAQESVFCPWGAPGVSDIGFGCLQTRFLSPMAGLSWIEPAE